METKELHLLAKTIHMYGQRLLTVLFEMTMQSIGENIILF